MHESQGKYGIEVTCVGQKGKCFFGHKPGDKIVFDGRSLKGEICPSALNTIWPIIYAWHNGAVFDWQPGDTDVLREVACPDSANPVLFEIRRIRERLLGRWAPDYSGESKIHER